MFTPWIKRKALKRGAKGKKLIVEGEPLNLVTLLTLAGFLVVVGVFVVQKSRAESWWVAPTPSPSVTPSPSGSMSPTPMPTPDSSEGRSLY